MVIDTNIFIKHLRAGDKSKTILSNLTKQEQIFITSIKTLNKKHFDRIEGLTVK